jgi:hypothetical protein
MFRNALRRAFAMGFGLVVSVSVASAADPLPALQVPPLNAQPVFPVIKIPPPPTSEAVQATHEMATPVRGVSLLPELGPPPSTTTNRPDPTPIVPMQNPNTTQNPAPVNPVPTNPAPTNPAPVYQVPVNPAPVYVPYQQGPINQGPVNIPYPSQSQQCGPVNGNISVYPHGQGECVSNQCKPQAVRGKKSKLLPCLQRLCSSCDSCPCGVDGCCAPIGCSNKAAECRFIFGSCRSFFGCYEECPRPSYVPPRSTPCEYGTFHRW